MIQYNIIYKYIIYNIDSKNINDWRKFNYTEINNPPTYINQVVIVSVKTKDLTVLNEFRPLVILKL